MTTTAISFRRGNTEENKEFVGVEGEIVADLGETSGDPTNTATVALHLGDSSNPRPGGIRMAREDLLNVSSVAHLATGAMKEGQGHNVAYNNLSNYPHGSGTVEQALKRDFNLASTDGSNINTTGLLNTGREAQGLGPALAAADFRNVTAGARAEMRSGLVKEDTTNLDTTLLIQGRGTSTLPGPDLARADAANVYTKYLANGSDKKAIGTGLAYYDLSNVTESTIANKIHLSDYEKNENKIVEIVESHSAGEKANNYPSEGAVISYVTQKTKGSFADRTLKNVTSWDTAYLTGAGSYLYPVEVTNAGSNYTKGEVIATTIPVSDDDPSGNKFQIIVEDVTESGAIKSATTEPSVAEKLIETPITYTDSNKGGAFRLTSEAVQPGFLMRVDYQNSTIKNLGREGDEGYYKAEVGFILDHEGELVDGTFSKLSRFLGKFVTSKQISTFGSSLAGNSTENSQATLATAVYTVDSEGKEVPGAGTEIAVRNNTAYLNKNTKNPTYKEEKELLNRKEIEDLIDVKVPMATPTEDGVYHLAVVDGKARWVKDDKLQLIEEDE